MPNSLPADPGFDPATVPPFPVLTLHLDEAAETVTLDGAPVERAPGQELRDAGIDAVVAQLTARQLEAVRVRVTTPGDDAWRMVVTADGDTYDTTPPEEGETATRAGLNRRRLLLGGGALALLGAAGGGAALALPRLRAPKAPPAWQVPGAGAQVPVAPPPGFSGRARWSIPGGRSADVCVLSSGHIGTVSDDGVLTLRHPDTAQPQWAGASAPDAIHDARRITWDGQDCIGVTTAAQLGIWSLTAPPVAGAPVAPTTYRLEQGFRAELNGPGPFIELPDWFVDLPAAQMGTRRITIPAGTRAGLRQADGTLHAIGADHVDHLDAQGSKTGEHRLALSDAPTQTPVAVWATGPETVLTAWRIRGGSRLALIRPADGAVLMDKAVPERIDQKTRTRDLGSSLLLVGSVLVSTGAQPFARVLEDFTATAADGATLYGTHQRQPATLRLKRDASPTPWRTFTDTDVPPRVITEGAAYIVAPTLDQTVLYAAPRA